MQWSYSPCAVLFSRNRAEIVTFLRSLILCLFVYFPSPALLLVRRRHDVYFYCNRLFYFADSSVQGVSRSSTRSDMKSPGSRKFKHLSLSLSLSLSVTHSLCVYLSVYLSWRHSVYHVELSLTDWLLSGFSLEYTYL